MARAADPGAPTKFMIYRNFVKALPWLRSVRVKLEDPRFSRWFLRFSSAVLRNHSAAHVPVCDHSYSPPLCTELYHDQVLTPRPGQCGGAPPRCDVGKIPVGEYLFDFRAANVSVGGQTMAEWFVSEYMLGPDGAGHPGVVGYYIDDGWAADVRPGAHFCQARFEIGGTNNNQRWHAIRRPAYQHNLNH